MVKRQMPRQHQDNIIGATDTLQVSIMKQPGSFLVAARGNNRFSDFMKNVRTD